MDSFKNLNGFKDLLQMLDGTLSFESLEPLPEDQVGLAVLGYPIAHSLSPVLHNSALKELSEKNSKFQKWNYGKIELPPIHLEKTLVKLHDFGYRGLNLTIPHKVDVLPFLFSIDPDAEIMGAVNTLVRHSQGWHGCNTDGYGMEQGLKEKLNVDIEGAEILLLGAGGASRAAAARCLKSGCSRLWLGNRSENRLKEMDQILNSNYTNTPIHTFPLTEFPEELGTVDDLIVINATSLGLKSSDPCPFDLRQLPLNAKIYDMIYNPPSTRLLKTAAKLGMKHANGLSMLVHQAAKALEIWSEEEISVSAMYQGLGEKKF